MLKLKNKMIGLTISALMLGATADTAISISQPVSVSAARYCTYVQVVCKSGLNIRTGNGTNYRKISAIPKGAKAEVIALAYNDWALIEYKNVTGWIYLNGQNYARFGFGKI